MVGLDAMEISVMRRAFAAGRLPNLAAFAAGSHAFDVASEAESLEGSVWPTFASGVNPGVHGHYWNMQWVPEEGRFVSASDERFSYEPFWGAALEQGRRVIAFDVPYVPPIGHDGERHYSGWGLQDEMRSLAHPRAFGREVRRRFGRSLVPKDTLRVHSAEDRLVLARRMRAATRQRARLVEELARDADWDFALFVFGETHLAGHHLALPMQLDERVTNETAMYAILQPLDEAWPRILAAADGCDVALFAVHGMAPRVAYWELFDEMVWILEGRPAPEAARNDLVRRFRDALPRSLQDELWLRLPERLRHARMDRMARARLDPASRVFRFEGDCAAHLRVNLQGRERNGVVPPEELDSTVQDVWREVQRYRTDEGLPLFERLVVAKDTWHGDRVPYLPDGLIISNPAVVEARRAIRDDGLEVEDPSEKSRTGAHNGRGFCFYRSADGTEPTRESIENVDFAPTILSRLGVAPPGHLEGTAAFA